MLYVELNNDVLTHAAGGADDTLSKDGRERVT